MNEKNVNPMLLKGFRSHIAKSMSGMMDSIEAEDLERARAIQHAGARILTAMLKDEPAVETVTMNVSEFSENPELPVAIYRPTGVDKSCPALLWIHGGGMVTGSYQQNEPFLRHVCKTLQCIVVAVNYRLAPEAPYPAPLEDCYATLRWMFNHANDLNINPSKIAIGGASAGGNLATGLALLARDRDEIPVMFQLLIYPMLDDLNIHPADDQHQDTPLWSRGANRVGWAAYLKNITDGDEIPHYAAPYRATDLTGLPPASVIVGGLDLFLHEDIEYAQRLMRAGVPTSLHVYPGAYHGFDFLALESDIGQHCDQAILTELKAAFSESEVV